MKIVIIGLSLSSSWGNGHATTFRSLIRGLHADGHEVQFLERDVPWYRDNRDLPDPEFCALRYFEDISSIERCANDLASADAVIIGSYVPEGIALIDRIARHRPRRFCFYDIDTPVTLARLEKGEEDYLAARQIPLFDVYFSFTGGPTLDRLEKTFGARRALPLYCAVDSARYAPQDDKPIWDLGYLGTYSADRQPTLERLLLEPARRLPNHRFVVAGPQYPDEISWPANVERIEHLPPSAHAGFYARQRFTLNVTRADMIAAGHAPSVRIFEAGACGTPLISDRWQGLDALLPENEAILIADDTEDVVSWLTGLSEGDRLAIAREARTRILARHTGRARARELVTALKAISPAPLPIRELEVADERAR